MSVSCDHCSWCKRLGCNEHEAHAIGKPPYSPYEAGEPNMRTDKGVVVYNIIDAGTPHGFVPSGHYNTHPSTPGLPENEVCWQLVVADADGRVRVCYAARLSPTHGDAVANAIRESGQVSWHTAEAIATKLRERGLVKP